MPDDDIILRVPRWQREDLTRALVRAVAQQQPRDSKSPFTAEAKHHVSILRKLLDQLDP